MRSAFARVIVFSFGWTLLSISLAQTPPHGSTPSAPAGWLGDPGVDVEKARSHLLEQKAARLRWEQATTLGDYERIGQKDPRWDSDVRAAFDQFAHALAQESDEVSRIAAAKAPCQRALSAGCTDPLVAYVGLRLGLYSADTTPLALAQLYAQSEQRLEKSSYSPLRKLYVSFRAAEQASKAAGAKTASGEPPPSPPGTDIDASLARAETHLVELLGNTSAQRDSLYIVADEFLHFAQHDIAGQTRVFAPLATVFESGQLKSAGVTATDQLIEGAFWIN